VAYVAPDFPLNDSKPIACKSRLPAATAPQPPGIAPGALDFCELAPPGRCQSHIVAAPLRRRAGNVFALSAAAVSTLAGANAHARAELQGIEVTEVHEAEHSVAIRVEGLIASVESRQVIVNPGDRETEVFYTFDLPVEAAVTGVEIRLPDGRKAVSNAVGAAAAFQFVEEGSPGRPDMGLLRVVDRPAHDEQVARYELRVFPVPAGKSAVAIVRWYLPARYRDGRLELRLPARGTAANRVRERLDVQWRAPAAARGLREVRAAGNIAASSRTAPVSTARLSFVAPADADIVLEARPVFRGSEPLVAELATRQLDKRGGAYALTVLSPASEDTRPTAYERVLLIVDTSRSLGPTGTAAARAIVDSLLAAATPAAQTEAIVFARQARALTGRLGTDRSALKKHLAAALSGSASNGSDLGEALGGAAALLKRAGPTTSTPLGAIARGASDPTLIVIVTDAMFPLALDGPQAIGRIGSIALNEARIASVVLVPDQAVLPDPHDGPLGELARRTGGRIITVRHGEAGARAPRLWNELAQPAPVREIDVDWRGAAVTGDDAVPHELEAGEGLVVFGWYRGRAPGSVQIAAELRGRRVAVRPRRAGAIGSKTTLALALINRPAGELLPAPAGAAADESDAERAERAPVDAAIRAGVATDASSLVALDTRDRFARDRLAFARKWGASQYRRHPPPRERSVGEDDAPSVRPIIGRRAPLAVRRTGELDRAIIQRLMKHHVVPRARACYDRALRRAPGLTGSVTIELEMVRGEVQDARISRTTITDAALTECLLDAAFATPVPQVALGDTSEVVVVARYPLRLRRNQKRPEVTPGADGRATDPDDPLGGLDP
jgi:hypothetical protein